MMELPESFLDDDFPLLAKVWQLGGVTFRGVDDEVERFVAVARRAGSFHFVSRGFVYYLGQKEKRWTRK